MKKKALLFQPDFKKEHLASFVIIGPKIVAKLVCLKYIKKALCLPKLALSSTPIDVSVSKNIVTTSVRKD